MGRTVYIGKPSAHIGKTAFELLANLKNFGIGRMLTRHEFDVHPEPSYHIVKRVETQMDPELKFGTIWCETVIRGERLPGVRPLTIGYRPDYRLIPKDEEVDFLRDYQIVDLGTRMNLLPYHYTVPPLMREWMKRHYAQLAPEHGKKFLDAKTGEFRIPFLYKDYKEMRKDPDIDLFWIANKIVPEDGSVKPNVAFDGRFRFNQEWSEFMRNTNKKESSKESSS